MAPSTGEWLLRLLVNILKDPEISVVLPVFREGTHIQSSIKTVTDVLSACSKSWEIVVVDDGSPDDTWPKLVELKTGLTSLRLIRLSRNFGKEAALCAGLSHAKGLAVLLMDGDLQHPPELIPAFVEAWRNGSPLVEGVKKARGSETFLYGLFAKIFYFALTRATSIDFRSASDFKLLDRRVVNAWKALPEKTLFFRGMVSWLGFPATQIEFDVSPRAAGKSSFNLTRLVRLAWSAMSAYSAWPLHFITSSGIVFSVISLLLLVQTIWNKLSGRAGSGFTTVISLQLLIGSVLILAIGILGEYLSKIFEEVKGRPRYIIYEKQD